MIIESITAFGGGSLVGGLVSVFMKLYQIRAEREERRDLMLRQNLNDMTEHMDALAQRTNNLWGNSARFMLMLVPQIIMMSIIYIGYTNPDMVIWVSELPQEPKTVSLLFGLFELSIPQEITYQRFTGIVVMPVMFSQMGAVLSYYLVGGISSRR